MKNLSWILLVMAAFICGCHETRNTRVTINTETGAKTIVENSPFLDGKLDVIGTNYVEVGDLKKAIVTVRSNRKYRLNLQARVSWLDADGAPIMEDSAAFHSLIIDGYEEAVITGMSPNAKGVTAIIRIREI
ncbi:MAG: YcfL family protein [Kiritimatiellae bacterium]|nr:YcfL family protein [Kiritimatiellia bacterium]